MFVVQCLVIAALIGGASEARAQTLPLPKLDSVNFFFQAGALVGGRDLVDDPSQNEKTFGQFGWGFETLFDMASSKTWDIELAVGYDQMFLRAKLDDRFKLRGTIKNLPSISIYASHESGFYAGFGTGVVSLSNVAGFDAHGNRAFSVTSDTFDLTARIGMALDLGEKVSTRHSRASLFGELAYHARFFSSVNYGMTDPGGLPGSLYIGGAVISVGAQVSLKSKTGASDDEIKAEVKRQQRVFSQPSDKPDGIIFTGCAGAAVPAGYVPIDDHWDPARCGTPSEVESNVWVLGKLPETSSPEAKQGVEVCKYANLPEGWKEVETRWDPTRCGRPESPDQKNIRLIRWEAKAPPVKKADAEEMAMRPRY